MRVVLVIPCYNEESILEKNIQAVLAAIKNLPQDILIVISDNNSSDATGKIGKRLAAENSRVGYFFVEERGKGAAVLSAWKNFDADIYGFMDADLSVDLSALPGALTVIGEYDMAIGSRRVAGSIVRRGLWRRFTSGALNFLIRMMLKSKIHDTACGFKFTNRKVLQEITPQIIDRKWTFDTELVILAERAGFRIKEIPVIWSEKNERASRVNVYPTAREYWGKIREMKN
jgi:hypothetical protein